MLWVPRGGCMAGTTCHLLAACSLKGTFSSLHVEPCAVLGFSVAPPSPLHVERCFVLVSSVAPPSPLHVERCSVLVSSVAPPVLLTKSVALCWCPALLRHLLADRHDLSSSVHIGSKPDQNRVQRSGPQLAWSACQTPHSNRTPSVYNP